MDGLTMQGDKVDALVRMPWANRFSDHVILSRVVAQ